MKKLLLILLSVGLVSAASAQHRVVGGFSFRPRSVIVVGGFSPFYPFGYSPFYSNYNSYGYRPTKLDLQVEDIKNDYSDRIWSVKNDESLTRKEKRQKVHELKHERDDAVIEAKKTYYKR